MTKARGPKSATSLTVVAPAVMRRPEPPNELSDAAREEWNKIVARMPVDWFPAETHSLLAALCNHTAASKDLALALDGMGSMVDADDEKIKKYKGFADLRAREVNGMSMLATKLRLTQQSRYQPSTAKVKTDGVQSVKPWEQVG